MDTIRDPQQQVLRQAGKEQLEQAVANNHRQLFVSNASALGGEVFRLQGLTYTHTPRNGAAVPFPEFDTDVVAQLDQMMLDYQRLDVGQIGFWSLAPAQPPDIGVYLLARGFQPGWQPCWMALEKGALQEGFPAPATLDIQADNATSVRDVPGLPYGDDGGAFSPALFSTYPAMVQRFIARVDGNIVGQTCLFFTTGPLGIAGMYNVGVVPDAQRRGIGKALVIAASRFAFAKGYQYVMLNANNIGRRTYEQVGFRFISYGCTWWLMNKNYITHPAPPALVAMAEATGRGDSTAMEKAFEGLTREELDQALPNGMSLMQFAAHFRQRAAAEWLLARGATCTPLDAWDLGWPGRAADILRNDPAMVNRTYYDYQGTLLHVAAERNDTALAKLALDAGVDTHLKDAQHDSTALGWAQFFGRFAIMALIKAPLS